MPWCSLSIAVLPVCLLAVALKHAAIDQHLFASHLQAIAATGDLAVRAEEVELHAVESDQESSYQ